MAELNEAESTNLNFIRKASNENTDTESHGK